MPKPKIIVERIPLDYRPVDIAPNFPPMPVLYLELIENKDKVLPDLRDKASQPIYLPEKSPVLQPLSNNAELERKERTPELYRPPVLPPAPSPIKEQPKTSPESVIHSRLKERMKNGKKSESKEKSPIIQDHHSLRERRQEEERDREKYKENVYTDTGKESRYDGRREESRYDGRREESRYDGRREESRYDTGKESRYEGSRREDPVAERTPPPKPKEKSNSHQTQQIRNLLGGTKSVAAATVALGAAVAGTNLPPSLEQITSNEPIHVQGKMVKDVTYTAQDEIEKRRDLMFRFDILRKSYKDASIPEISQFMDVEALDKIYQDTVRRVALDSKVESYRRFLNMGFMGMELLFSNILKIDMTGFAKQQMASMNSYEKILIELGEKSLLDKTKSQWPAEVRLLFTIVMNAVIFVMTKAVMGGGLFKAAGGGGGGMGAIGGLVSGLMGAMGGGGGGGGLGGMMGAVGEAVASQTASQSVPSVQEPPKASGRKMRGPSTINIDELGSKKTN
jgi:hypothetical protein